MGGTAIRHSTRSGRATAGTTRAVPDGSTTHSSADRIVVNSYNGLQRLQRIRWITIALFFTEHPNNDKRGLCFLVFSLGLVLRNVPVSIKVTSLPLEESNNCDWQLQWRHNEGDGVSNHKLHDCLHNRLFRQINKYQSSATLAFVREVHRWLVNSLHKEPVTRSRPTAYLSTSLKLRTYLNLRTRVLKFKYPNFALSPTTKT